MAKTRQEIAQTFPRREAAAETGVWEGVRSDYKKGCRALLSSFREPAGKEFRAQTVARFASSHGSLSAQG